MAITNFGVNDTLAVKLWSKTLDAEALKYTDIGPLIGDSPNAIIHRKSETSKGPGDSVTYGIRMQLAGAGFTENQLAEGNGESLSIFSDAIVINELGHVVSVKNGNTIDAQRVPFNLREEARDGLADWYAGRFQTDIRYTGLQAPIVATRIVRQSSRSDDASLISSDTFTINLIDKVKEAAITATPKVRPVKIGGQDVKGRRDYNATLTDKYVMYLHPYQVTDLRISTSTGQWLDITKAAITGGQISGNGLYTGAIGEYNGVILRSSFHVTNGVSNAGATQTSVYRSVLLGGQACMMAFGQKDSPGKYRWNEELFDHKRRMEVSAWTIHGIKKVKYNSLDYGVIVCSTWAAAHV
jgi:N4-gp56 family major capsid protein